MSNNNSSETPTQSIVPLPENSVLISQGAEARVYRAKFLGRDCIIKERFKKKYRHPELDQQLTSGRITREARTLTSLFRNGIDTPGVLLVDLPSMRIFMEDVQGKPIKDIIETVNREEQLEIGTKIGTTIAQMHELSVMHGDLTTSNMMLRSSGSLVLLDFGLSFKSTMLEDKAVDLYVLERAFLSTHPNTEKVFERVLSAYAETHKNSKQIIDRLNDGGIYGLEDSIGTGYPLISIISLLIIPWIWSFPAALMTAELSSALPDNGGFILWTKRAFGPFLAFQTGYWSFINTLADNALYPVLFNEYFSQLFHTTPTQQYVISMIMILGIFIINILGIELVGHASILFAILVLSPGVVIGIWGLPDLDFDTLGKLPPRFDTTDFSVFLSVILWNTSGWDNVGAIAGEVKDLQTTYPRAMIGAVVLVIVSYVWPLAVSVCVDIAAGGMFSDWEAGYFPIAASRLSNGLKIYSIVIGLVSAVGLFNVIMCTSARMLYAMAPYDMLGWPALGKLHPRFGTPWVSLLINAVGVALFVFLPFQQLVQIDNLLYSLSLILEFLAIIWLRIKEPELERPYKIPMGTVGLTLFMIPPIILCLLSVFYTLIYSTAVVIIVSIAVIGIGLALWGLTELRRRYYPQPVSDVPMNEFEFEPNARSFSIGDSEPEETHSQVRLEEGK